MLTFSHQLPYASQKRSVSFSPEVEAKEEQRAICKDKKEVTKLLLQSDVAFVIDKSYALELLKQAKIIIDNRFSNDESLLSKYAIKMRILNKELGNA